MSNREQGEPVAADASLTLPATATVVAGQDGDGAHALSSRAVSPEAVERAALKVLPIDDVDSGKWAL